MSLHTPIELFNALRTIIPNIPESGVVELTLKIKGDEVPEMHLIVEAFAKLGANPYPVQVARQFYIVTDEEYDYIRTSAAQAAAQAA